ncbi:MAG TPA: response regulator [Roseiflexaceae bacterium]|nr:response regulator [Roseiflexaceae bacterium]
MSSLARVWQWLTLVRADDPVRYALNRGFAYVQVAVLGIAILLTLILITTGGQPAEIAVNLLALPIYLLSLWLNRRGTIYGEVLFILMVVFATAAGLDPRDYAGPHPNIHVAFMFSIVCATLFIRPLAGIWAVLLQIGALGVALSFSDTPPEQIRLFLITGALHLGGIAAFLMVGAAIFSRALRASIVANAALRQLNEQLEQRVGERTADLAAANQALRAANALAEQARAAAEEANFYKTRFLTNMSHELRTPLNAIINFAHFLGDPEYGQITDQQQMFQSRILYNGEHLLGLINDILDLSKIEAGKMDLVSEVVELDPLFHGVMSTAAGLTKEKGLVLELDVADGLPAVWIDKTRIRQVLLNLLSNAAKFTDRGGITLRACATGDGFVRVSVQDSGPGIAPEHQERVFEEFQQVQGDLDRTHAGTGLGLPISKRLIELHSGRMWLESTPGAGATFSFTIPVATPGRQERRKSTTADAAPASMAAASLIAVIDDDADSQQILRTILGAAGYQVYSILDSRTALAELDRVRPAMIILDLNMEPLDGWTLLAQLRADARLAAIPVVICSITDPSGERVGLLANVVASLPKPVRSEELLALVQRRAPPAHILVIDDDADARQMLRAMLERLGHVISEASSGRIALALIPELHPDLILLDLMMPEMDGFEVIEHMSEMPAAAHVPVVVVTAKNLDAEEQNWLRERTRHCCQKPVAAATFLAAVRAALSEAGASRQMPDSRV